MTNITPIHIRQVESKDYEAISPVMDDWWGGRPVRQLLPRLYFEHFATTSFILLEGNDLAAFLVGFLSQSQPGVAYIHFVGVAPTSRSKGYGRILYSRFFETVAALGCTEVQCITSPVNGGSVTFHERMGFRIVSTGGEQNGFPVDLHHAGEGQHRVKFSKCLNQWQK
jgi:ribosomal protein S18 acetylase RimI-like enzyme